MTQTSIGMKGYALAFLIGMTAVALFPSCKKEKKTNTDTPAYYIAESEKLAIPATVDLPAHSSGYTRVATLYAIGVQKYKAQPKASNPSTYEWAFVGPEADLFDLHNRMVGTHGAGPFWQLSSADSIFAQAFVPARTSPSPHDAIDWLLLMTKPGKTPTGRFADVACIQRIATTGGKAPLAPPANAHETATVPYTAVYRFSKKNP